METIAVNEEISKIDVRNCNYSDDEIIFKELCTKCHSLEAQNMKMHQVRKELCVLNEKYENIYNSLLKTKTDYDLYKSNLYKTLFTLKVSADKQKILARKKLEELYSKQKQFEEYYKVSPCKLELDELTKRNRNLELECQNKTDLLKLTKKQYNELESFILETFKRKVCEFCDIVLRLKAFNN